MKNGIQNLAAVLITASLAMPLFAADSPDPAQTGTKKTRIATAKKASAAPGITAEDIKSLRDAIAAQQQQIEQLRQELRARDDSNRQAMDQLRQAQTAVQEANVKAQSAETAA